ncbi:MAG: aminodeoxychorismate/anthranilate synthase component II, partial [Staphylococcus sp.]|nr:aminodeoxychorismate/anthranilate synthase component II [Staphylococcus sp.]
MIIVIDNNDSFTYNLIDYIKTKTSHCVKVIKVTEVTVALLEELTIEAIVISPGPGKPSDYPILKSVLDRYASSVPI